jgi:hypothetical protein
MQAAARRSWQVSSTARAEPTRVQSVGTLTSSGNMGVGRCILQADAEPAQRALLKNVVDEVCRTSAIGVAPAHTPAYDHQADGAVEKAVRDLKGQVRVMMSALSKCFGTVGVTEPVPSSECRMPRSSSSGPVWATTG